MKNTQITHCALTGKQVCARDAQFNKNGTKQARRTLFFDAKQKNIRYYTKKDAMIPQCGNLEDLASGRFVVGAKQLRKAVAAGRAKYALLAKNADPAVTEPLIALCENASVAYDLRYSMQEIGKACGIEVGAAAACAVTD